MSTRVALLALALAAGCTYPESINIDLRTDFVPGIEFTTVRTRAPDGVPVEHMVDTSLSYAGGVRIAELDLPPEPTELRVQLVDPEGLVVAERPVQVQVGDQSLVTVIFTRDCRDVACPTADDEGGDRACLGGSCVDPSCTLQTPATCDVAECVTNSDCLDASRPTCVTTRCVTGACLFEPSVTACGDEQICHPERGCRPTVNIDRCPTPDEQTVILLDFDEDDPSDAVGRNPATEMGTAEYVDGPFGCGRGYAVPTEEDAHLEIPDATDWHLAEGSLDLWFRPPGLGATRVILSREQRGLGNGHFSLFLTASGVVIVRFQDAAGNEAVSCSEPVTAEEWHYLGVNFGAPGLELWVDGARATRFEPLAFEDHEATVTVDCGAAGTVGLRPADTIPWVLGAGGNRADDPMDWADFFRGGAIDHFRISSVRRDFTTP